MVSTISTTGKFTFKIGNSRVVENIFPEEEAMIYENSIIAIISILVDLLLVFKITNSRVVQNIFPKKNKPRFIKIQSFFKNL